MFKERASRGAIPRTVSQTISPRVRTESVCWSDSQSVIQSVSQSVSQSVGQPFIQSGCQSVSQ